MKSPIVIFFFMCFAYVAFGQSTGINNPTPNSNAALDVVASGNQGMLIPRITDAQRLAITNPPIGLICYSTTNNTIWYYNGTVWVSLSNSTSGAGAANKLAFWSGASTLGFNTNLHWDNTNGRLGIGTVLPTASLSVGEKFLVDGTTGQLNFTDATGNIQFPAVSGTPSPMMYMFASGTTNAERMVIGHSSAFPNWGLQYTDSDDKFHFVGNGTKYMTIGLGNGFVGIGTTTPNAQLQFSNTITNRKLVLYESATNDHQYYGFGINGGTLRYQTDAAAADHVFFSATSATASKELMRITGNGLVGIGTASPSDPLTVKGTGTTGFMLLGANNEQLQIYNDGTSSNFVSDKPMKFSPNGGGTSLYADDGDFISYVPYSNQSSVSVVENLNGSSPFGTWLSIGNSSLGGQWFSMISTANSNGEGGGKLIFTRNTSAGTTIDPIMTLAHASGFAGVGVTNPKSTLHVNGDIALGSGAAANGANKAVVVFLTNNDGTTRNSGDIVIAQGPNGFACTGTSSSTSAIGVLVESCPASAVCKVAVAGVVTVNSTSGILGQHCVTAGTKGNASTTANPTTGSSIGVYLTNTTGTQCQVLLK